MDRNSAIGLTLIAVLLLSYFYFFSPTPPPPTAQKPVTDSVAPATTPAPEAVVTPDSVLTATYGDLASAMKGEATETVIENEDVRFTFSNHGGILRQVELKNYKTYTQEPLRLITPETAQFKLLTQYQGRELDLYSLYYQAEQQKSGDTTLLTYHVTLSNGAKLSQTYKIPARGYEVGYDINGFDQVVGDKLSFEWTDVLKLAEKDMADARTNTTINYYTDAEGFDKLSERSTNIETEVLAGPVQWISIKEKFFLSAIIARQGFTSGEVQTSVPTTSTTDVKSASVKLALSKKVLSEKQDFKFYFGPNDYKHIGEVAPDFQRNVFLGWKPIYWINKFVIFPVFHFLTSFISNYGLIIVILVILLKLVLLPLSYRSYLSMAKMRLLKPELDEIKERVGDDMTKVQQEQMKLYQQVGVNPISGCVPVLLQMPLILSMFYLFPASIELRQQHFLWAEDLSTYDSLIQLPFTVPYLGSHISLFTVLMTISTLVYTWQNNQISSVQGPMKSMSYIMPVIFFFVLNSFSAGLTFYYLVSNLVTFAQQAVIKRFVDENKIREIMEDNRKKNAAGQGKKSKFMSKLEEAMKASEEARRKAEDERKRKKDNRK